MATVTVDLCGGRGLDTEAVHDAAAAGAADAITSGTAAPAAKPSAARARTRRRYPAGVTSD
jgi:hypothetical protein